MPLSHSRLANGRALPRAVWLTGSASLPGTVRPPVTVTAQLALTPPCCRFLTCCRWQDREGSMSDAGVLRAGSAQRWRPVWPGWTRRGRSALTLVGQIETGMDRSRRAGVPRPGPDRRSASRLHGKLRYAGDHRGGQRQRARTNSGWTPSWPTCPTWTSTASRWPGTTGGGCSTSATSYGTRTARSGRSRPSTRSCPGGPSPPSAATPSSPTCARPTTPWTAARRRRSRTWSANTRSCTRAARSASTT